jgi:adenylate cyclase
MTSSSSVNDIDTLLIVREAKGLRFIIFFRLLAVVMLVSANMFVAKSLFEFISVGILTLIIIFSSIWFLKLLQERRLLRTVGVVGALSDCLILALLPPIWYTSLGGDAIPTMFMLKVPTHLAMAFSFTILNCFAARALYPLMIVAGTLIIRVALFIYAAGDIRTIYTEDFVGNALGATVSPVIYFVGLLIFAAGGLALAIFTWQVRKTIDEAVFLERTTRQLKRYFSPNILPAIAGTKSESIGKGKRQSVAIMFADIRDFTSMSERMRPEDVVEFLSDYHARMTTCIFAFGGTLDKFIGDGIMATFGTPEPSSDDALKAVQAGLMMKRVLMDINEERLGKQLPALRQGIGIHYGEVVAGNIGSEDRLEYTVIGDAVNIASRIEGACKDLGEDFLVSSAVVEHANTNVLYTDVGEVKLKGKADATRLYAVRSV